MLRWAALLPLSLAALQGQVLVDASRLPAAFRDFTPEPGEGAFSCSVQPIRPTLNFGFRFQAGWVARVGLGQFQGKGHRWAMIARVTPEAGGKPVYLASAVVLPEIPKTKVTAEIGGGFLLGEGKYRVDWLMMDERNRVCRKQWSVSASLRLGERRARLLMPPNTVSDVALRGAPRLQPGHDADARRLGLTVFLHAAPMSTRRTRLRAGDRVMLLGTLSALLEQTPTRRVRLVVFNLEQQRVLLREDNFTRDALDRVAQSMNEVELGTVDYQVLRNRRGHLDLLADMVNRELAETPPAEAVVVLGPATRFGEKLPQDAVDPPAAHPDFYYFQLHPYSATATFPDALRYTVGRFKGKTLTIRTPGDFAKAIGQIVARAATK